MYVEYGYLSYLVITSGYFWLPALPGIVYCKILCCILCGVSVIMYTSVTWWVPVVTFGYRRYLVLQDPRLYTWSTGQHCYHSYLCLARAVTIIVQWIHCIVALPELPLLPVTWAYNLTTSPPYQDPPYCRILGCIHGVLVNTVTTVTCV